MKITRYITLALLVVLVFSCKKEMLVTIDDIPRGIYVTFELENSNINSEDIEGTPIYGTFNAPASNVARHDIYVKRIYDRGDSETDFVFLESVTSFPYEFSVTGSELASLFNVDVEEIFGNFFQFNCEATGLNGQVATWDNLDSDLVGSTGQLQGFRFRAAVICPSDPNVIVGTYTSVSDGTFIDFPGEPVAGFEHTITISTTDEEGFYSISCFSFGLYDYFFGTVGWIPAGDWEGTIQDVCGAFFITNTFDFWGDTIHGDFTFNDDGTITVVGGNTYGDIWTAVLTKL
jgi:hypothetical protein